jgi:hypothetical protein
MSFMFVDTVESEMNWRRTTNEESTNERSGTLLLRLAGKSCAPSQNVDNEKLEGTINPTRTVEDATLG